MADTSHGLGPIPTLDWIIFVRWGAVEWIERPRSRLGVQTLATPSQKIPLLYLKPSGSLELGVWSLYCIDQNSTDQTKSVCKKNMS